MGCLAPRRIWFYLLYPCSNNPCNSFNCFFLHFKRNQTNCYELYLSSRFYRIYTFNDICILHVVLVKATSDRLLKNLSGLLICLLRSIFICRGDLRSPVGEHSSPLPCIGERFCDFSANFARSSVSFFSLKII